MRRWVSAGCPAAGSSSCSARSAAARRPWRCAPWPGAEAGEVAAYIDAEHALDEECARRWGSILTSCWSPSPITASRRWLSPRSWSSPAIGIIVIDSVAALVPKAELDGEMGASHVGLQARMMCQALRKLTAE